MMTNAERFKQLFGLYATELWSKSEKDFLTWLNMEYVTDTNVGELISIQDAIDALEIIVRYTDHDEPVVDWNELCATLNFLPSVQPRNGKWIIYLAFDDCYYAKCDQCHESQVFYYNKPLTNFCPNCGASMEEGDSDD